MSGGFALVAWPAAYDVTGVMTFIVSHDGIVHQKDLGLETDSVARSMMRYNPDQSWQRVAPQRHLAHAHVGLQPAQGHEPDPSARGREQFHRIA